MENKEIKDIMENRENNLQVTCPVLFPENERAELKDIERSLRKRCPIRRERRNSSAS